MKQNITIEQLSELSEKGKEKLLDWWQGSTEGKIVDNLGGCGDDEHCESRLTCFEDIPPLSIAQMIEFLDENFDYNLIKIIKHPAKTFRCIYKKNEIILNPHQASEETLCDALWQAVKEILEN